MPVATSSLYPISRHRSYTPTGDVHYAVCPGTCDNLSDTPGRRVDCGEHSDLLERHWLQANEISFEHDRIERPSSRTHLRARGSRWSERYYGVLEMESRRVLVRARNG